MQKALERYGTLNTIVVATELVNMLGWNEAVVLSRLMHWIGVRVKSKQAETKKYNFKEGKWWVYNTYDKLIDDLGDTFTYTTMKRTMLNLEELGLVESAYHGPDKTTREKWYTINEDVFSAMIDAWKHVDCIPRPKDRKERAKFTKERYEKFKAEWQRLAERYRKASSNSLAQIGLMAIDQNELLRTDQNEPLRVDQNEPLQLNSSSISSSISNSNGVQKPLAPSGYAPRRGFGSYPNVMPESATAEKQKAVDTEKKGSALVQFVESSSGYHFKVEVRELFDKPIIRLDANSNPVELPTSNQRFDEDPIFRKYVEHQLTWFMNDANDHGDKFTNVYHERFARSLMRLEATAVGYFDFRSSYIAKNPSAAPAKIEYLPE